MKWLVIHQEVIAPKEHRLNGDRGMPYIVAPNEGSCFRCGRKHRSCFRLELVLQDAFNAGRFAAYLRKQKCGDVRTDALRTGLGGDVLLYACGKPDCEHGLRALGEFLLQFGAPHPLLRRVGDKTATVSDVARKELADAARAERVLNYGDSYPSGSFRWRDE